MTIAVANNIYAIGLFLGLCLMLCLFAVLNMAGVLRHRRDLGASERSGQVAGTLIVSGGLIIGLCAIASHLARGALLHFAEIFQILAGPTVRTAELMSAQDIALQGAPIPATIMSVIGMVSLVLGVLVGIARARRVGWRALLPGDLRTLGEGFMVRLGWLAIGIVGCLALVAYPTQREALAERGADALENTVEKMAIVAACADRKGADAPQAKAALWAVADGERARHRDAAGDGPGDTVWARRMAAAFSRLKDLAD